MRKLHEHKENTVAVLLCDVTAYAEVFTKPLPRNPFFNCYVRELLNKGCFCGSIVLAWNKYAAILLLLLLLLNSRVHSHQHLYSIMQ
jgi:hypothetical protein